uniref:VASt domain-containing protein n=1 Tax=Panagrellus redivivus TaxID=6233 RepID=A0A7E4VZG4_PANRE
MLNNPIADDGWTVMGRLLVKWGIIQFQNLPTMARRTFSIYRNPQGSPFDRTLLIKKGLRTLAGKGLPPPPPTSPVTNVTAPLPELVDCFFREINPPTFDVFYNSDTKKAAETVRRPRPSSLTSTPEGQHHSDDENNVIEIPTTASTPATPVDMTVEKRIRVEDDAASDTASASSEDPSSTPDRPDPSRRMLIESGGPGGDARTLSSAEFFAQLSQKFEARPKIQKLGEKLKTLLAPREQHHFAHFRRLFEGHIAEGDGLIMSFACNYKSQPRDFPVHGRMYLTLSMIGFSCQLLGYEKKILLPLRDIVVLEKDRTTNFFANSIKPLQIVTATGDTHNFGSLKSRDRVYSLLFRVWRMNAEIDKRDLLVEDDDELDQLAPGTDASTVRHDSVHMAASDTTSESSADGTASNASTPSMAWPAPPSPSPVLPADCPCIEHKGRVLMDLEVPLTIHQVFNLLFTENKWLRKLDDQLKRSEKSHTPWSKNTFTEPKERNCTYVVELDKTFGPKCATVNEIQKYVPIGEGGIDGFTLHKEANNEGVPYADSFCVDCYYCVTRVTPTVTRIRVHGGVVFRKYIFGIIKTVIEKSTVHGLDAYYSALSDKLKTDSARLPEMLATVNHDEEEHAHPAQHHHHMHHHHHLDAAEEATPTTPAPRFSDPSIVPSSGVPATATHGVIGASPALSHELTSVVMLLRVIIILLSVLLITQFWFASHSPSAPAPPTDAFTLSTDISSLKSSVASLHAELQLLKSARAVADL